MANQYSVAEARETLEYLIQGRAGYDCGFDPAWQADGCRPPKKPSWACR
jgi:hypothetical protein